MQRRSIVRRPIMLPTSRHAIASRAGETILINGAPRWLSAEVASRTPISSMSAKTRSSLLPK